HKFWDAVETMILSPRLELYPVWRHTTLWLVLFSLIEANVAGFQSLIGAWAFVFFVTAARIAIVGKVLSTGEIIGAAAALCIWPVALCITRQRRAAVLACMLLGYVIIERLQPFVFDPTPRQFGWLPFRSFMEGSLEVNVLAFLEKCFLYGGLLFLLAAAGHRLRNSTILVAVLLFCTSWAETFLPGRSAEVTDAVLVL